MKKTTGKIIVLVSLFYLIIYSIINLFTYYGFLAKAGALIALAISIIGLVYSWGKK